MWELQFEIETKCSLNCVHCSSFEMRQHKNRYYTDDDLINFIKLFETSLHIYFTGGEPINYKMLPVLCKEIQEISQNIREEFKRFDESRMDETFVVHYKNKHQMWYFFPYLDSEYFHTIWINDYLNKAWYKRVVPQNVVSFNCGY